MLTGTNSAVGLRSMPARFLFLDEVDAYHGHIKSEGDLISLAEARARTFGWRRKAFLVSTPTIAGRSRIEREYASSDQRRYFLPCPQCGAMQWLKFERLIWEKGDPRSVRYHCEDCDTPIEEHHKTAMLAAGEWRPTASAENPHTIGFHISALYSPVGWLSWEQIARDWEAAQGKAAPFQWGGDKLANGRHGLCRAEHAWVRGRRRHQALGRPVRPRQGQQQRAQHPG